MKRILGLDLGTTSIGWALVEEAENKNEKSSIVKLGVRVNPLSVDEKTDFEKGRPLSTNASRTQKRGTRRNLQRYKLRRKNLIEILQKNGIIDDQTPLTENEKNTTHKTFAIRARAAKHEVKLEEFAIVLLAINKKRGYKSSRKAVNEDDGVAIDSMQVAKHLYENDLTPGQYALSLLQQNKKYIPDFYRSDLKEEFTKIWEQQAIYYPKELTVSLFDEVIGKSKKATWAICQNVFNVQGIKRSGKKAEQRIENYEWRTKAIKERIDLEQLIIVLQEINKEINGSSGYLGAISDRSKELFF